MMGHALDMLEKTGFLPSLPPMSADRTVAAAGALHSVGLAAVELSLRAQETASIVRAIREAYPDMAVAISGVHTADDACEAQATGADLLLATNSAESLLSMCAQNAICLVPLCVSATEITAALHHGFSTVQYYPCEAPDACAQLYALFGQRGLRFIAGGGITESNHLLFADKPYITAVRGDFLCPASLLEPGMESALRDHASRLYRQMLGFELGHVGINTASDEEGHGLADSLGALFGAPAEHGHVGNWNLSRGIEVVNGKGPGVHGHIAVQCNNLIRAIYYLEKNGHPMRRDSFRFRYPGRLSFAYLEESFAGFAIHLMLRWTAP